MAELILTDEEKKADSYLDFTDKSLANCVRASAFILGDRVGKESLILTTASVLLIKQMLLADSEEMIITLAGVKTPKEIGDWVVTIRRKEC